MKKTSSASIPSQEEMGGDERVGKIGRLIIIARMMMHCSSGHAQVLGFSGWENGRLLLVMLLKGAFMTKKYQTC